MDGVWRAHAQQWARVGPPLRPVAEDGAVIEGVARGFTAPRVLVLGVTPEMAGLAWPPGARLLAVDKAPAMIARVWPGFPGPEQGAVCADWLEVPLEDRAWDLIVSDGCFTVLPDHGALLDRVARWLAPDGRFVVRTFVRGEDERPAEVFARATQMASFHELKLRLLMAVQGDAPTVRTGDVWRVWEDGPGDVALAAATGWPLAQIATIDAYRGQDTIYAFPTEAALTAAMARAGLTVHAVHRPGYPLGDRCPTFVVGLP